ncbi:hypothetical protein [Pseudarthrobacter sp. PS3-L1]|uniref:hypothetical protein n=1 Tax=Pseudarthrobacter sp. PS3-L1 TaxID=3046207 RepID=UPI0024B8E3BB|nr:hypothetical protein [Pseudarthrobacter sp. PS3-L1]MDJ0321023.1 hypothetical protein [Pseudarthrobacter sp. PS3-L1]
MRHAPNSAETRPAVPTATTWRPVLFRAVVSLAFGAVTIFWATQSTVAMGILGGLYLAATGAILLSGGSKGGFGHSAGAGRLLAAGSSVLVGAGVAAAALHGEVLFAVFAVIGLGVMGLMETISGILRRGQDVLARDWLVSGVIGLGTAVLLPFFTPLGVHALLGVAGGGAVVSGVLWILSGLSLRHDSRPGSDKP